MADLLYFQKDWAKCGPAFDSVVAEDPNGPQAAEAAYASVLCHQNIYTESPQGRLRQEGPATSPTGRAEGRQEGGEGEVPCPRTSATARRA